MNNFERYLKANARLDALIDLDPAHEPGSSAIQARAIERFSWMRQFLASMGDPQFSVPVIHVTGTSGKGSTATAIASILQASGRRTLLHTSPYLQVATEKLQVDGRLIGADDLADLTERVIAAGEAFEPGRLTYGEAWMAMVFLAMERFQPDVAIVEVGAGGRFDLSNVVQPEVAVISTVGLDHVESLGSTIAEIAWHKAGIIKSATRVVHSVRQPEAIAVMDKEAVDVGAASITHLAESDLAIERVDGVDQWLDAVTGIWLGNGIPGQAQVLNGALAVAAARAFDPSLSIDVISTGLSSARIPARFEQMPGEARVVLDGAHNVQKVESLLRDLPDLPGPRVGVVGFLASKRFEEMLTLLAPFLDEIVVSAPEVVGKAAISPVLMAEVVAGLTEKPVHAAESTRSAVGRALELAGESGSVIVTGSLYLCGQARELWYASALILEQRTQWPG